MTTHHNFVLAPAALLASPNVTFNPSNQWVRDESLICSTSEGSKASTKFIGMMGTIAPLSVIGNITLSPSMIHSKNLTTFLVSTITLDDVPSCVISFDIPSGALNTATPLLYSVPLPQDSKEHTVALTNNFSGALVCLQNFSMEITGVVNSLANETSPNNIESTPTLPSTSTTSSFTSSSLAAATSLTSSTSSTTGSWSSSAKPTISRMTGDHDSANGSASKRALRLIIAASLAGPLACLLIAISVLFSKSQKSRSCSLPFWSDSSFRKIDPYPSKVSSLAQRLSFNRISKSSNIETPITATAATIASTVEDVSRTSSSATLVESRRSLGQVVRGYLDQKWSSLVTRTRTVSGNARNSNVGPVDNMTLANP